MKIRTALILAAGIVASSAVAIAQSGKQLSIATGGTGGVYYPLGGGFANILSKALPGITATAEVTGGSVDNLKLIGTGKADIAFVQVDASWDAINGLDKFASGKLPVQALVVMYANHMHVVTIDGTGISKIEDLKGKRISTGSPGSATEVFAFRVLEAAGLDKDKDVKRERRRVLLGGRLADGSRDGLGGDAVDQNQAARYRAADRKDECQVRPAIRAGQHSKGHLHGHGG
jgi:uncharacterized protein